MSKLQVKTLTFNLVTKADEPLNIEPHVMEELVQAMDTAARNLIDLRYGHRLDQKTHEYVGVILP